MLIRVFAGHTGLIVEFVVHWLNFVFNDRFHLSFFVATHGFRESDFDYYSISYSFAYKSRPNVSMCVY